MVNEVAALGRVALARAIIPGERQPLLSLDVLVDLLPVGMYVCDAEGIILHYNRQAAELWGRSPRPGDSEVRYCGALRSFARDGRPLSPADAPMREVLLTGAPVRDREVVFERPDGTRVIVLSNLEPLVSAGGQIVGALNCLQNVTHLVADAPRGANDDEQLFHQLLEALPAAVYTTDAEGRLTFFNTAASTFWGRRPQLGMDQYCGAWRLFWPDGTPMRHDQFPIAVALREGRESRGEEGVAERPDGTRVPFLAHATPLRDGRGGVVGAVNMLIDISAHKHSEEQQQALIHELNHRVKNTLATVQSIAAQSMRGAGGGQLYDAFEARLVALSRAHDHLTRERWKAADLRSIIEGPLARHHAEAGHRIRLSGPPVKLSPQAAVMLAMILQELTSNAVRHGSLSAPEGRLSVTWQVVDVDAGRQLEIDWQESGGPPVQPPARAGFGRQLIERGLAHGLNGTARLRFDATGLVCCLSLPLSASADA